MNIASLIAYLNTITAITTIVWNRIYWWVPKNEETQTYLTISIISEVQPTDVEKRNRVEFRMIWGDTKATYSTLKTLDDLIVSNIRNYTTNWVYRVAIWNLIDWYDSKNRKILIRDLIIYYSL